MKIEYSLRDNPTEHFAVENVTQYTHTPLECLIFNSTGLVIILPEDQIEDFIVSVPEVR